MPDKVQYCWKKLRKKQNDNKRRASGKSQHAVIHVQHSGAAMKKVVTETMKDTRMKEWIFFDKTWWDDIHKTRKFETSNFV